MCTLVQRLNATTLKFQDRMDDLNEYMQHRMLPDELRKRLRSYVRYCRDQMAFQNEEWILKDLSPELRLDVCYHTHRRHMDKIVIFQGIPVR